MCVLSCRFLSCFHAPATPELYPLSLHDALPISPLDAPAGDESQPAEFEGPDVLRVALQPMVQTRHGVGRPVDLQDRKSTRLNSSHRCISYAVFCLKKKNTKRKRERKQLYVAHKP